VAFDYVRKTVNMTATLIEPGPPARAPERRTRARRIVVAVAAIIIAAAGVSIYLVARHVERTHLDHQYGPIEPGATGGQYSGRNLLDGKGGFSARLSATPDASALMFETLDNRGRHSVTITSIPTGSVVSRVRWSVYSTAKTRSNLGDAEPWRALPATVPPHGTIRLLITIHRPAECQGRSYDNQAPVSFDGDLNVHWKSLLGAHVTPISFPDDFGIRIC
jgi:hypothetical protein